MLCVGTSLGVLVAGRLLQGLSAAMVWTVGLALMVDTVGKNRIGQAMGYITISLSLAVPTALILGGVVYDRAGYYAVYYMSFGLLAIDIFSRLVMVEKKIAIKWLPPSSPAEDGVPVEQRPTPYSAPKESESPSDSPPTSRWNRLPPVLSLLKSRRLLTALWVCLVEAGIMAAFESVRISFPLFIIPYSLCFYLTTRSLIITFIRSYLYSSIGPSAGHRPEPV